MTKAMSDVTNVLLAYDLIDAGAERLEQINAWLHSRFGQTMLAVSDRCVGGSKRLESALYAAAFNHFVEEEFIDFLRGMPWQMRRSVQVIIKKQDDIRFSCVDVYRSDEVEEDLLDL